MSDTQLRRPASVVGPAAAAPLTPAEWRLKALLQAIAFLLLALSVTLVVAGLIGAVGSGLHRPPWIGGAAGAGVLLVATCAFAAGDPRRRFGLVAPVAIALAIAAAAQLAYLVAGTGAERPLGAEAVFADRLMWGLLALEVALLAAVLLAGRAAAGARSHLPTVRPALDWGSPRALRWALIAVGGLAAILAAGAAAGPFVSQLRELFDQPLLSAHLAAGAAGAAALCWYIATDLGSRLPLAAIPALALLAAAAAGAADRLWHAEAGEDIELLGATASAGTLLEVGIAAALVGFAGLTLLRRRAFRSGLEPRFLGPAAYRALMALADVIVEGPEQAVPPRDVARNVDEYFDRIRARRRHFHRIGLWAMQVHPAFLLKAPFSELDEETRLHHLQTRFHRAVRLKRFPPEPLRRYTQAMLRMANQLTYIGYYSDERSFPTVGYERFTERDRFADLVREGKIPTPGKHPLVVQDADDVDGRELDADYCIVGSGAAGAILAYRLAEADPSSTVIVLERGEYVEPCEFSQDEVAMIGRLYGDGVFQQSEDFRFTVLQGSCVGGTTVVNNAVSIPLREETLERWNSRHRAGIDPGAFERSTRRIERWLPIGSQEEGPANPDMRLNPSYPKFLEGVARRRADAGLELDVSAVRANIDGCLGCGYCNIGCRYGKKLSMLDTVLPWAQRDFGPERVRILARSEVRRIVSNGGRPKEATAAEVELPGRRRLRVRARKFILAAGAVSSPYLLQRSGIGKGLPVGRHASFNMGAPLTAEFDEDDLDAYDGLQISHVGEPPPGRDWVMETWWNPPVAQALNMPGWFDVHYENMRRYRKLMAVGVLVGTERNARIGRARLGGPAIDYMPTPGDMRKLADGLIELGHILFAGGAKAIMVNGWEYYRFTSPNGLYELPSIMRDPTQLALGTGHPQGGAAISADPGMGVVDPSFTVHGYSNLYVCDASVLPTSITVNPQLTVMALADYAAPLIADEAPA